MNFNSCHFSLLFFVGFLIIHVHSFIITNHISLHFGKSFRFIRRSYPLLLNMKFDILLNSLTVECDTGYAAVSGSDIIQNYNAFLSFDPATGLDLPQFLQEIFNNPSLFTKISEGDEGNSSRNKTGRNPRHNKVTNEREGITMEVATYRKKSTTPSSSSEIVSLFSFNKLYRIEDLSELPQFRKQVIEQLLNFVKEDSKILFLFPSLSSQEKLIKTFYQSLFIILSLCLPNIEYHEGVSWNSFDISHITGGLIEHLEVRYESEETMEKPSQHAQLQGSNLEERITNFIDNFITKMNWSSSFNEVSHLFSPFVYFFSVSLLFPASLLLFFLLCLEFSVISSSYYFRHY
jgi:hypothetical protein